MKKSSDIFLYSDEEVESLKRRDIRLAAVIGRIGRIKRWVIPDLFVALVNAIVGQQISTKAHESIWRKMCAQIGTITPEVIDTMSDIELQQFGISFRKAAYIKSAAHKVLSGAFNITALNRLSDDEVCARLVSLDGVGVWTAEMLMLFSLQRRDILSFGDFAIQRGMRMVYRHRVLTKTLFAKYRKRLSPYGSVASLYFWAVAGGAIPDLTDPASRTRKMKESNRRKEAQNV